MDSGKIKKYTIVISFFMIVLVFVSGLLFGYSLSHKNINKVDKMLLDNELNSESYVIEQELFKDIKGEECDIVDQRVQELSMSLGNLGRTLSMEDVKRDMNPDEYDYLKIKYHLSQIKTYTFIKKIQSQCKMKTNVIVMFYSTNQSDSVEQGKVLDEIAKKYPITVFSIQYNYSSELKFFENYYNVTKTPTLIINFDNKTEGPANYADVSAQMQ